MQILNKHKIINMVGLASTGVLAGLALATLCPSVMEGANAEEGNIPVSIDVEQYLTVALKNAERATMQVAPELGGSFVQSGDITLDVSTNNPTGYKLAMSTSSGASSLVNASGDTIESITGEVSSAHFPTNQWGYNMVSSTSTDKDTYASIPSHNTVLDSKVVGKESYTINFGAKVDGHKSGSYSNTVIMSAVANPTELSTLSDLTYMQDMTTKICENTLGTDGKTISAGSKNEPSKQLIDMRDGKYYWVSKLADQNCWMTQNLDLDIPASGLKSTDTDIVADWNDKSEYPPEVTREGIGFDGLNAENYVSTSSWNMGRYVVTHPLATTTCSAAQSLDPSLGAGYSLVVGQHLGNCPDQVQEVDNTWKSTLDAGTTDYTTVDSVNKRYDAHYLIGNYYQWNTATAGTGGTLVSEGTAGSAEFTNFTKIVSAAGSICPKGWTLPKADDNPNVAMSSARFTEENYFSKYGTQTFSNLFNAYGYEFPSRYAGKTVIRGNNEQNGLNVAARPFYFARGGTMVVSNTALNNVGSGAYLQAGTATELAEAAFVLRINETITYPSDNTARTAGFPVRCLAR